MKIWNLCEEWSKPDLPKDVWTEILSRLPVKSLLRFRSISKSWLALLDDPEFARFHIKNFRNNRDEAHLLVFPDPRLDCVLQCSETFVIDPETICTFGKDFQRGTKLEIACSVDGLLLITRTSVGRIGADSRYPDLVWNPSIRKFCELPSLPYANDANGLGYDKLAKDYKIVKLIFYSQTLVSVAIFTLGGNSWKITKFPVVGGFKWHQEHKSYPQSVYFRGCLYFIASKRDLVAFELSNEVFSFINFPDVDRCGLCQKLAVVDGGSTMAAFYSSRLESSVWVLDTESMDWTKRYTCQLDKFRVLYIKSNGDILARKHLRGENYAPENGEEPEFLWWKQVVSYRPKTDEYKIVQEEIAPFNSISHVCGYVQSLVMHK